jgi:hypothetical protein
MGKITCKDCPVRLYPSCGEMKLTEDEMGNIKAVIEFGRNDATSVNTNAGTLRKALQEKQKIKP